MAKSTDTSTDRTVAPKQLIALLKDAHQKRDKIQSIAGELGERVKAAIENGHLHRGAFALMGRLYKMEEFKREDFIRQIQLYIDICREQGLFGAEHVGDLVDQAEGGAEDEEDVRPGFLKDKDADASEANAAALESGIKPLAEKGNGRGKKGALGADAPGTTRIQ